MDGRRQSLVDFSRNTADARSESVACSVSVSGVSVSGVSETPSGEVRGVEWEEEEDFEVEVDEETEEEDEEEGTKCEEEEEADMWKIEGYFLSWHW